MSSNLSTSAFTDMHRTNDMPRWNTDNLMTHVAAAALIVDDFEVDVNDLREDLKIENKEYVAAPSLVYRR